jgi:hypothetical protein
MTARGLAVAVLLVALAGIAVAGTASAAAPCWKKVTLDWAADGTIDATYPLDCYTQAEAHMSEDLDLYSSFREDLMRARSRISAAGTTQTTTAPDTTSTEADDPTTSVADGGSGDDDSPPLALLVLGGVAVLLVAAGVGGMLWQRARNRPSGT